MSLFTRNKDTQTEETGDTEVSTTESIPYTTQSIADMAEAEFNLIAFSLSGKVAGRISSFSMSLAGTQRRQASMLADNDQPSIDKFNEQLSALDEIEAQNEFMSNAGQEAPLDKEQELRAWLGVRQAIMDKGFKPNPMAENFKWMIEQTATRNRVTDEDIAQVVESSSMTTEEATLVLKTDADRSIQDTVETATHAMRLLNDYEPDQNITPDNFDQIVRDAIESSEKTAVKRGNDTKDRIANLLILASMKDI